MMGNQALSVPPWVWIIGALVRLMKLPAPAPPTPYGALMVLGLPGGYLLMNWFLTR